MQLLQLLWDGINLPVFGYFQLQKVFSPEAKGQTLTLPFTSCPGQTTRFRVHIYLQVLCVAVWRSAQAVVYRFLERSKRQGDCIRRIFKLPLTIFYEDLKEFGNKLLKVSLVLNPDIRLRWKVWFTVRRFILGKSSILSAEDCLTVHLSHEIILNANLMQQGNFIDVFLARHVSGTYAHYQEH